MIDSMPDPGMATLLLRVVIDPVKRDHLYEVLHPFCHECRNYLNTIKLGLYLAKRSESSPRSEVWNDVEVRYEEVERYFDRLQFIYRPITLNLVRMPLGLLFEEGRTLWVEQIGRRGRRFVMVPPQEPAEGEFDPQHLRVAFDAFVAWRARTGDPGQEVSLRWRAETGRFHVKWNEPGMTDWGLTASTEDPHVSLALPLLAHVISAHAGTLNLTSHHGLTLSLSWPLAIGKSEGLH
jgi:hypothetical protein